ncbi:hypothetical protein R6Z07F_013764 [Ovis aries]
MVAQESPVTTWCQGSLMVDVYRLYKEKGSIYWEAKTPQGSRNKAKFYFASSSSSDAGQYQCAYQSRNGWSVQSDPLPLVLTDYTVQNLTRVGLAASVLLLLGILLCQARHDREGARDAARS